MEGRGVLDEVRAKRSMNQSEDEGNTVKYICLEAQCPPKKSQIVLDSLWLYVDQEGRVAYKKCPLL
jgi:hypothetical protein